MAGIDRGADTVWRLVATVAVGVILSIAIAIGGYFVNRADVVNAALIEHEQEPGHPAMTVRMTRVESDIGEIKQDIRQIRDLLSKIAKP